MQDSNYRRPINNAHYIGGRFILVEDWRIIPWQCSKTREGLKAASSLVSWSPPRKSYVKLNVNGSCGGIIRDDQGRWICAFSKFVGKCNALMADIWGIYEGLKLIVARGFERVEINCDSLESINIIEMVGKNRSVGSNLVRQVHVLLSKLVNGEISHSFREANRCADELAKAGRKSKGGYQLFHDILHFITETYENDFQRSYSSRVVLLKFFFFRASALFVIKKKRETLL